MRESLVGLVIRADARGENGKLLTLLTAGGKRFLSVSGAKGIKSRFVSACHLFSYCEFQVEVKNGHAYISDAALMENFYALRADPLKVALASYVCEVAGQVCTESGDEREMLSLVLNVLHVLAGSEIPLGLVKAVFEARVCVAQGISPELDACRDCGETGNEAAYLDVMNGSLLCADCLLRAAEGTENAPESEDRTARILLPIEPRVRAYLSYLLTCPPKKIFRFGLDPQCEEALGRITEAYMQNHLECRSSSLGLYREMKKTEDSMNQKRKETHETG